MTLDLKAAEYTLSGLRPFPVAVTTIHEGRPNGLMSLSAGAGGIVPEAPRVTISLTKYNLTHDLVLRSGVFAMHLLAATPEPALDASLRILMGLGGSSGRDGDKIAPFDTKPGVTGAPILLDALSYVEGRVPFGYRVVKHDGIPVRVPEPAEQSTIVRMKQLRDAGNSLAKIAEQLTAEGRKARAGKRWYEKQIARVLSRTSIAS